MKAIRTHRAVAAIPAAFALALHTMLWGVFAASHQANGQLAGFGVICSSSGVVQIDQPRPAGLVDCPCGTMCLHAACAACAAPAGVALDPAWDGRPAADVFVATFAGAAAPSRGIEALIDAIRAPPVSA